MAKQEIVALAEVNFAKIAEEKEGSIKYGDVSSYEKTDVTFSVEEADFIDSPLKGRTSLLYKNKGQSLIIQLPKNTLPADMELDLYVYRVNKSTTLNGTEVEEGTLKFRAVPSGEEYNPDEFKFSDEERKEMMKIKKRKAKEQLA